MRKFTKQISTLIALATAVSANPSIINAESTSDAQYMGIAPYTEETVVSRTAGIAMSTETEMTPLMGDVYYTSYPEIISTIGTIVTYDSETTTTTTDDYYVETTHPITAIGTFVNTDDYYEETIYVTTPIEAFVDTSYDWATSPALTGASPAAGWPYSTTPTQDIYQSFYGDIDLSGKINNSDLVLICQALIQDVDLIAQQKAYADINQDGDVDIADAAMIKSHLLGDDVPNIDYPLTTTTESTDYTSTTTTTTYDMPIGTFSN